MRISDWSSDVCSSDLHVPGDRGVRARRLDREGRGHRGRRGRLPGQAVPDGRAGRARARPGAARRRQAVAGDRNRAAAPGYGAHERLVRRRAGADLAARRSEEHTSELQSLMRISYAVFCLKKKKNLSKKLTKQVYLY